MDKKDQKDKKVDSSRDVVSFPPAGRDERDRKILVDYEGEGWPRRVKAEKEETEKTDTKKTETKTQPKRSKADG